MTAGHILAFVAGVFIGAIGMAVWSGCRALHKAVRDAMRDLGARP